MGCLNVFFKTWIKQIYGILNVYEMVISFLYLELLDILDSGKYQKSPPAYILDYRGAIMAEKVFKREITANCKNSKEC